MTDTANGRILLVSDANTKHPTGGETMTTYETRLTAAGEGKGDWQNAGPYNWEAIKRLCEDRHGRCILDVYNDGETAGWVFEGWDGKEVLIEVKPTR